MFFIKLIRYVLGYITFTASGGFSERFINLCAQKKIVLWDVESKGGVIFANTNIIGYKRIKDCAKRSSMKVRIKEKHGIPFLMHKHRVRVGFLVGFIVFILLIVALSTRLWTIEIEGNDEVTNKEILQVFDELGVSTGTRIAKIDVTAVTEQAKDKLEQISWLALNISGSKATIEVRESIKKPKIEQRTPCNIVAAYGGQIIKLEVYEGQTQQVLGAAVAKGDLLISGVVENLDGTAKLKHAKGIIVAKTNRNLAEIQPAKITQEVQVKEKKRYRILFFGLDIPLFWLSNKDVSGEYYRHEFRLTLANNILPVGYVKEGYKIYEKKEITLDESNCQLVAFERFSKAQREKFEKVKIVSENVEVKNVDGSSTIKGSYECEENICQNQEIYLEN